MGGGQTNQKRADLIEQILAGQNPQQSPQRDPFAHLGAQPLDQRQGIRLHPLMNDGSPFSRSILGPEPRQQRLRQIELQIHQFFGMQVEIGQLESLQTGVPQAFQRAGFSFCRHALPSGRFQQPLTRSRGHIGLKAPGDVELLDLPDKLAQGQSFDPMDERYAEHFAPADRPVAHVNQHGFGLQFRALGERRVQIRVGDPVGPIQPAKFFVG